MPMTLRLEPELDAELTALAEAEHVSKQQLVARAIREYTERNSRMRRTLANTDRVIAQNEGLLDRLGR